jgi:hypothetical protein
VRRLGDGDDASRRTDRTPTRRPNTFGDLSRRHPETRIRLLAAPPDGDAGVGSVEVTSERLDAVVDGFHETDAVVTVDVPRIAPREPRDPVHRLSRRVDEPALAHRPPGDSAPDRRRTGLRRHPAGPYADRTHRPRRRGEVDP